MNTKRRASDSMGCATKPKRVEIFHSRDPDSPCGITIYVDGEIVTDYDEYDIDPGRGHEFGEYADSLARMVAGASDAAGATMYEEALAALDSPYTEKKPDDWRVAVRYFDLLIAAHRKSARAG